MWAKRARKIIRGRERANDLFKANNFNQAYNDYKQLLTMQLCPSTRAKLLYNSALCLDKVWIAFVVQFL